VPDHRIERDSMGEMRVPSGALYGAQTQRAVLNFPISNLRLPASFISALARIKSCAARVNGELGEVPSAVAGAIHEAAQAIARGEHLDQFAVDVFQTGSGTSTNMNANEVIARVATASLNQNPVVHPNDHVNWGQSSNDVIPSAMHVSAATEATQNLLPAMGHLAAELERKSEEFSGIIKIGRTHLQDAVPMTLGQEFSGYARQVRAGAERIRAALDGILELPLGGTAVGTGLNANPQFAPRVIRLLADECGIPFREASNHFEAQASKDAVCFLSGALRTYSVALTKIANDIRWLGSGPRCGLGELRLPPTQPGSSIMPGKVNPVIAESVLMACAQVIGYDAAITWCGAAGNFELNTMMPVMAYDLLESVSLLAAASRNFSERCIQGLEADRERIAEYVEQSLALVTALVPEIGYDRAASLAKEAYASRRTIREVAKESSGIPDERLTGLLDPVRQAG
jgi:fumarate hydratase, class II